MRQRTALLLVILLLQIGGAKSQPDCLPAQKAFFAGEELRYNVTYNWGLVWLEAAWAKFTVARGTHKGRACYYFRGEGNTYSGYDWIYKVRDLFEAWTDTAGLRPLKFSASMHEGSKHEQHTYLFDERKDISYTIISRGKKPTKIDTVSLQRCSIDVLSAIYHARSIDYSRCKVNDTIPISLLLDGKVYPSYVRYKGKATYTSKQLGTYRCIKFSPLLVEGSIFKAGEDMTVWVSDDENKLPLYIETPIIVGKIKVSLTGYNGLRFAEEARVRQP